MPALYIQSEHGGPRWRVWPLQEDIPPGVISEAKSFFFDLHDSDDAIFADLLIDGVSIEALRTRSASHARWRWAPGFHAGLVEAMLKSPSIGCQRFEITTDPDLRKLTRSDFDTMVKEVLEDTFALFSLSAFRKGIGRQQGGRLPPLARLEFLRSRAAEILRVISDIERKPRRFLRARRVRLPHHRARTATGEEIIRSFRSGKVLSERGPISRLPASLQGRLPEKVEVREHHASTDIPEHRQIKACLCSWASWLADVAEIIERQTTPNRSGGSTAPIEWSLRARSLSKSLYNATRSGFLANVGDSPPVLHLSSIFRSDPAYQRFYRLWQEMNLGLAAVFGDFLQMPLAKTYQLYELWCFLRLLRSAIEEFGATESDVSRLFAPGADGSVTILANAITVPIGTNQSISFQRRYQEYWLESNGRGTFSRHMIPDIVLGETKSTKSNNKVIVLDAKYRIDEGLNEALNSIHTYRDALVMRAGPASIEGIVSSAYLLTPHIPNDIGRKGYKDAPLPGRLFHPQYRSKFRFGAITLRPGMSDKDLRDVLRTILRDAAGS